MQDLGSAITAIGPDVSGRGEVLTLEALAFIIELSRVFRERISELLGRRQERQTFFDGGGLPAFLPETMELRKANWTVASIPDDLQNRCVEITGPVDRKMVINALNSGANVFMAVGQCRVGPEKPEGCGPRNHHVRRRRDGKIICARSKTRGSFRTPPRNSFAGETATRRWETHSSVSIRFRSFLLSQFSSFDAPGQTALFLHSQIGRTRRSSALE